MTDDTQSPDTTGAQHEDTLAKSVREGLSDATIPLSRADPTVDAHDIDPVGDRLADVGVVGLGEATHGTREFFELKHRLIRHLVVEHGVRAVALESNLSETMALHDYVVHGEGNARDALANVRVGCWKVETVLSMVEWLRAFNADRPLDDRVAFYGFTGHSTHGAVERLRDHFEVVDPDFLDQIADDLAAIDDGDEPLTEDDLTAFDDVAGWITTAGRVVERLRDHLDERRAEHVDATAAREWARARRYVAVIEQVLNKNAALECFEGDARNKYTPTQYLGRLGGEGLPGRTMADNVAWIRDQTDADTLVVWAHDAHLNRVSFTMPDADASAPSLGRCLAERHGDDYLAVGFSFARGRFYAIRETDDGDFEPGAVSIDGPVPGTLDAALDALTEPLAFVDLRWAREDDRAADWLAEPRPQFRTGGTYDADAPSDQLVEYVYTDAFDGVCFVGETTPARPLDHLDADRDDHSDDFGDHDDHSGGDDHGQGTPDSESTVDST